MMSVINMFAIFFKLFFISIILASNAYSEDSHSFYEKNNIPMTVLWGDTHVHTNLSADSYAYGNTKLTPDMAYSFAKGKEVTTNNGQIAKLRRPLDFLVVADHGYNLGVPTSKGAIEYANKL